MFGGSNAESSSDYDFKEHRGLGETIPLDIVDGLESDDVAQSHKESAWQPSFSPEPSYTKPTRPPKHGGHREKGVANTHHHNLPYENYATSGRPNKHHSQQQQHYGGGSSMSSMSGYENDEDQDDGEWQASDGKTNYGSHGYRPSEMHSSSTDSAHRTKKHKGHNSSSSSSSSGHKKRQKKPKRRPTSSSSSHSKSKNKGKHGKKSRSLETELRPPPADMHY